jgi:hypothetical protein
MSAIRINRFRFLVILALALLLGTTSYAFAASNTVPETGAGDGAGKISGYTAGSIHYNLNTSDPSKVDSVSFTLTPTESAGAPNNVRAAIDSNWANSCTLAGSTWTCSFSTAVSVAPTSSLRIVAVQ